MAQLLGALSGLEEDLGSVPSIPMVTHNCLQLQFQGSNALFWPPWELQRM